MASQLAGLLRGMFGWMEDRYRQSAALVSGIFNRYSTRTLANHQANINAHVANGLATINAHRRIGDVNNIALFLWWQINNGIWPAINEAQRITTFLWWQINNGIWPAINQVTSTAGWLVGQLTTRVWPAITGEIQARMQAITAEQLVRHQADQREQAAREQAVSAEQIRAHQEANQVRALSQQLARQALSTSIAYADRAVGQERSRAEQADAQLASLAVSIEATLSQSISAIRNSPCFRQCDILGAFGQGLQSLDLVILVGLVAALAAEPEAGARVMRGIVEPLVDDGRRLVQAIAGGH